MKMKNLFFYLLIIFTLLSCSYEATNNDFPSLFPFVINYDGADNVTNMSLLLDGPAGKDGFIRIENGRFVNDAGPVRLNGTNLTGSANFPSHEQADLLASRLARFGINCVRLHYMDADYENFKENAEPGIIENSLKTQRNLSLQQLDRLDYMIAQFKKRGIHVNINLHVARKFDERDGFPGKDQRPHLDKGVDNVEPRMIELQKEYAEKLLTHVNPYTGLPYTSDPCVAMIEINNENALFHQYHRGSIDKLPEPYASEFKKQWNEWLQKKYGSIEKLYKAWDQNKTDLKGHLDYGDIPPVKNGEKVSNQKMRDFYQFLFDTEQNYWLGMYNYLKNDLKVKSIVSGTQVGYSPPFIQAQLDYVDSHSYWCHPQLVGPEWKIRNESMVNYPTSCTILQLANQRVWGKPYTVSEYNHPFPNQYGAEGQPMLRAYGRLQGWDGVFQYTYNHRLDFEPKAMTYFFDMIARTDVLVHMPACAAIFLRGDVHESKNSVIGSIDFSEYFNRLVTKRNIGIGINSLGFNSLLPLLHKTAVNTTGKVVSALDTVHKISDGQNVFISDTGELTWNIEQPGAGYWTVNTSNTKLFTGFPKERKIKIGNITLSIGKTRLGWATISLTSKNATGFGESDKPANILLAATGLVENKGMTIEHVSNNEIRLSDWGKGPICVEGIPAEITLPANSLRTKCYALDPFGARKKEIPVVSSEEGIKIAIDPKYKTVWYEVEIK